MKTFLRDLYSHQAWADAEHWRAFEKLPRALEDASLLKRLHHIHFTQRAFLSIARGEEFNPELFREFAASNELKDYAQRYHREAASFMLGVSEAQLAEQATIPWFRDPPLSLMIGEAMAQAAMHSHYHRAQNATRLRELGGEPPMTDLIVWYWKERPEACWP